jgi:Spy/CpxP family protein refolding chaperone
MKKVIVALLALGAFSVAATSASADPWHHHHHKHCGWMHHHHWCR